MLVGRPDTVSVKQGELFALWGRPARVETIKPHLSIVVGNGASAKVFNGNGSCLIELPEGSVNATSVSFETVTFDGRRLKEAFSKK